jgi:hypothetical protein
MLGWLVARDVDPQIPIPLIQINFAGGHEC